MPARAGDLEAGERAQRRVERLDRLHGGEVGPRQHAADGVLPQERGQRLHLGQLGHPPMIPERGLLPAGLSVPKAPNGCPQWWNDTPEHTGGNVLPSGDAPRRALVPAGSAARRSSGAAGRARLGRSRRHGPARLRLRRAALGAVRRSPPPLPARLSRGAARADGRRTGAAVRRPGAGDPAARGRGRRGQCARLGRRRAVRTAAGRRRRARTGRRPAGPHRLALRGHPGPRDQGRRDAVQGLLPLRTGLAGARLARAGRPPGRRPVVHRRPLRRPTPGTPGGRRPATGR